MGTLTRISKDRDNKRNTTIYHRSVKDKNNYYTMISNKLVKDDRLSFIEVGIMTWILSNNDSFILNKGFIQKRSGLGRTVFNRAWKALEDLGYIQSYKAMISGQGSVYQYTINETPADSDTQPKSLIFNDRSNMVSRESAPNKYQPIIINNTNAMTSDIVSDESRELILSSIKDSNRSKGKYTDDEIDNWKLNPEDEEIIDDLLHDHDVDELTNRIDRLEERESLKYVSLSILYKDIQGETWREYKDRVK